MIYRKVNILHEEGDKQNDIIIAFLADIGYDSFEEKSTGLEAYIKDDQFDRVRLKEIIETMSWQHQPVLQDELLEDKNWNVEWENSYPAVEFPDSGIRVRAPFHEPDPGFEVEIIIEPGMAFGTGHHETTAQILEVLGSMNLKGKSVADIGCGSGVLAIYAAMKGADSVFAFDNDEWAAKNASLNFEHNKLDPSNAVLGDASSLKNKTFDLLIANINRNIILHDIHLYVPSLKQEGILILSGFLDKDVDIIQSKSSSLGLEIRGQHSKNSWVVLTMTRT